MVLLGGCMKKTGKNFDISDFFFYFAPYYEESILVDWRPVA
jgi:hypothetical protein